MEVTTDVGTPGLPESRRNFANRAGVKQYAAIRTHRDTPHEEPRWHASLAVIAALALYITLPPKLTFGPVWVAPVLIGALLLPLSIFAPSRHQETRLQRAASIALIAILNFFNVASIALLIHALLFQTKSAHAALTARELFVVGAQIWLTNILVFAQWYWELDGGGPEPRAHATSATEFRSADFLYPQMALDSERVACAERMWKPMFLDYIYLAFTNALAFSPTDTMPLSRTAKVLMMLQALISFLTIAVIFARVINIIE